jgi:hypothetical protein
VCAGYGMRIVFWDKVKFICTAHTRTSQSEIIQQEVGNLQAFVFRNADLLLFHIRELYEHHAIYEFLEIHRSLNCNFPVIVRVPGSNYEHTNYTLCLLKLLFRILYRL